MEGGGRDGGGRQERGVMEGGGSGETDGGRGSDGGGPVELAHLLIITCVKSWVLAIV